MLHLKKLTNHTAVVYLEKKCKVQFSALALLQSHIDTIVRLRYGCAVFMCQQHYYFHRRTVFTQAYSAPKTSPLVLTLHSKTFHLVISSYQLQAIIRFTQEPLCFYCSL